MTLIRWANSPSIINEFDSFFDNVRNDFFNSASNYSWNPNFEVLNMDSSYIVRADLPGLTKKDVDIKVTDNIVTISGERKGGDSDDKSNYYYSQLSYGSFSKSFSLPEDVLDKDISAKMKDGVLTLEVPRMKPVEPKSKRISIK